MREYVIDIRALFHVPNGDWFSVVTDIRPSILAEFRRRGVELAVPVRKNIYLGELFQPVGKRGTAE